MRIKIRINKITYDTLCRFGDIDSVVNNVLSSGIDVMRKPTAIIDANDCVYRYVNVTDQDYLDLLNQFGMHSNIVSLSRLLEWFVDNEIYEQLGWQVKTNQSKVDVPDGLIDFINIKTRLLRIKIKLIKEHKDLSKINKLLTDLGVLKEELYGEQSY